MQTAWGRIEKQNGRVISSYWKDEKSNFTRSPSARLAVCRLMWGRKHIWKSLHIQQYTTVIYVKVGGMTEGGGGGWGHRHQSDCNRTQDSSLTFRWTFTWILRSNQGMFSSSAMSRGFSEFRGKSSKQAPHTQNQLLLLLGGSLLTNSKYHSDKV